MKLVMLGSGGVGGYYGARLIQAGHEVTFVARGAHAQAMREHGLRIRSEHGDARLDVKVADAPHPADLIVMAVKLWDTEAAAATLPKDTPVVSLQNGIDKDDVLSRAVGANNVVGGITHIAAVIAEPGVIAQTGKLQRITLGQLAGGPPVDRFVEVFRGAGIEAVKSGDILRATWEKFVFLSSISGLTSLTRKPIGPIREHAATRALLVEALREAAAVARAEGAEVDPDKLLQMIDGLSPAMYSSMSQDLLRGRRLELEWLSGAVVRRGGQHGIATPVHRAIYAALVLHAQGSIQS